MPRAIQHPMTLFADDSTVIFTAEKMESHSYEIDINLNLNKIITWLNNNNLNVNLDKTYAMSFKQRINQDKLNIKYADKTIEETKHTKFLGLYIDENMKWSKHIEHIIKKLNQFQYALHNLGKIASRETVLTAYHAYVSSTLRYGIMFWGNSSDRELVFKAQKKCLRAVCKIKATDSCRPHFIELKIMTFPSLYAFEVAMFVKKHLNLFETLNSKRHRDKIHVMPHKTALYAKSFLGMAPKIYNKIPTTIRAENDVNKFKRMLKDFMVKKAYYSIGEFLTDNLDK